MPSRVFMNPLLDRLPDYPFERLRALFSDLAPKADVPLISLGIGEPKHPAPAVFLETLSRNLEGFSRYPETRGERALREAIGGWLSARYGLGAIDPDRHVIPCSGTREALFGIAQAAVDRSADALVLLPNPFYQIYEGATLWAGATPCYVNATEHNGFWPDFSALPARTLDRAALLYVCTPGNPTGQVASLEHLKELIRLADRHDFIVVSDECYSEIYPDEGTPPPGILEAARQMGRANFERCIALHSLSKRSNIPGARCGSVAGDPEILRRFLRLRTYTGATIPPPIQAAAAATWRDEAHVLDNRARYREKFRAVVDILSPALPVTPPAAGFYLWPRVPGGGEAFARRLFAECGIVVLPGAYLAREAEGINPGADHVRMALVDTLEQSVEAAWRIRRLLDLKIEKTAH